MRDQIMGGESADKPVVTQAVLPYSMPPGASAADAGGPGVRHRKVRRAIGVAKFDAWATAIFAGLTVLVAGASFSWTGLIVGAAMAFIATQSFRGLHKLVRLDESGPRLLGYNQLLFAACLIIYASWNLYQYTVGPGPLAEMISEARRQKRCWLRRRI